MSTGSMVSIVVCAYNAEKFIEEALQSLLRQRYPNIEIIVVDDGSIDSTPSIVQTYKRHIHYIRQSHQGISAARNAGIARCSGEYLCFFDADDIMTDDRIAQQVRFMEKHPDVGLSIMNYRNFTDQTRSDVTHFQTCPRLMSILQDNDEIVLDNGCVELLHENFSIMGTGLIRKKMLEHESNFDSGLAAAIDYNFFYRIARHTRIGVMNKEGMLRRIHGDNVTCDQTRMLNANIINYNSLLKSENDPVATTLLRKNLAQAYVDFARLHANKKELMRAIQFEWHALRTTMAPRDCVRAGKNICRALAITLGLFISTDVF